jgi:hypothetical protein
MPAGANLQLQVMRRLLACFLATFVEAPAIDIRIYSEFQRVNHTGEVVLQDRAVAPRDVLSPGVPRNGFVSFRVVVTAAPNTFYFLAVQTNPPDLFRVRLYREIGFVSLIEERNPAFLAGVIPPANSPEAANSYLLDLWVPPNALPGPTRVEVLVKTADWKVAPMEVRILPVTIPTLPVTFAPVPIDPNAGADLQAFDALLGRPTSFPATPGIARNAAQDAAIMTTLDEHARARIREAALAAYFERRWPFFSPRGSEAYLPVRQLLYREAAIRQATHETRPRAPGSR